MIGTGTGISGDGLDEDESFFQSYDAEQAAQSLELDVAAAQPPSPEQLAHAARFRKPVAWIVAGLSLLSVVAFGMRGSQQSSQRALVAHYSAALPASTALAVSHSDAQPAQPASEAAAPEPIVLEPMVLEPNAAEPSAAEPNAAEPSSAEPSSAEPSALWPTANAAICRLDASAAAATSPKPSASSAPHAPAPQSTAHAPLHVTPAAKPVAALPVAQPPKPAPALPVAAPSAFNSVARFPDAQR